MIRLAYRIELSGEWMARAAARAVYMGAILALRVPAAAQVNHEDDAGVTYAADVAELIQTNCAVCHRPSGIAPMNLVSYDDVRRYAQAIREQVSERLMPPYYYDRDIGIQELQHDWRLSEEQIRTIVAWVDQGAPLGDTAAMPRPPDLVDTDDWSFSPMLGAPDLVVLSKPIDVPANGLDMWHRPYAPVGMPHERCIKALQVKPQGEARSVVHHANSTFQRMVGDGSFEGIWHRATGYAMGKIGELIPDGVCRILPADAYVLWDIHLFPGGIGPAVPGHTIRDNVVELGIWLHPPDYEYEYMQDLATYQMGYGGEFILRPNGTIMLQGLHMFDHPVRIDSFQPHGHLRLRAASLEILYPDTGRVDVISRISNWSAMWHQSHVYEPDAAPLVPLGAAIILKQWYDNTGNNPNVVDPDMWVGHGSRTADEMSHAWIAVTHLDEEGYQELLNGRAAAETRRIIAPH